MLGAKKILPAWMQVDVQVGRQVGMALSSDRRVPRVHGPSVSDLKAKKPGKKNTVARWKKNRGRMDG
jgi:hypothetical protein